eukprot:7714330-Pyramimonas_sp.AAC.1
MTASKGTSRLSAVSEVTPFGSSSEGWFSSKTHEHKDACARVRDTSERSIWIFPYRREYEIDDW